MEHLLLPHGGSVAPSERAPYVAEQYDQGSFLNYPSRSRHGDLYELLLPSHAYPGDIQHIVQDRLMQLEAFLQTWLVFGLLYEILGVTLEQRDFVTTGEDGSELLSTASLPRIVETWTASNVDQAPDSDRLEHLISCIVLASRFLKAARRVGGLTPAILWTTASIGETMESVVLETFHQGNRSLPIEWAVCYDSDQVRATMEGHGWCPTDITRWRRSAGGLQNLYYLSKLQQPVKRDHTDCIGLACVAQKYDISTENAIHRCENGDCGTLYVDLEVLKSTLDEGSVGLLDIAGDIDRETTTIPVVSSTGSRSYVALSHVWADGLGNPVGNYLPRCQVSYVGKMVKSLGEACGNPHLLLWLDTLCCPVASEKHRGRCLLLMRQIYEKADYVLVLDAQLKELRADQLDSIEICTRLMFSSWMRRLWTLQEGALARRLYVQLRDGPVDFDQVQANVLRIYQTRFIHNPLTLELVARFKRLRNLGNHEGRNLVSLDGALKNRSVTVPSDEPLCLCTCMSLDQSMVVSVDGAERMKAFWMALGSSGHRLPKSIVFCSGPRLPHSGFRWAPQSFLGTNTFHNFRRAKHASEEAMICEIGLFASFPALQCSFSHVVSAEEDVQLQNALGNMRFVRFAKIAARNWIMMLPEASIEAPAGEIFTVILERGLDTLDNSSSGNNVSLGLGGLSLDSHQERIAFDPIMSVHIHRVNQNLASTLDAVLYHGEEHNLFEFEKAWEELEPTSSAVTSESLRHLPAVVSERLLHVAKIALSRDPALGDKLITSIDDRRSEEVLKAAVNSFAELLLFYLAGRFGEVVRVWSDSQLWCIG